MSADIFALLQSYTNTQTIHPAAQETPFPQPDGEASLPGLFASLMNECIAEGEGAENPVQMFVIPEAASVPQNSSEPHMMTFTGSSSFPQSVMNILAGETEITPDTPQAEIMPIPENDMPSPETAGNDDGVIWPDDAAAPKPKHELADDDIPHEVPEHEPADDVSPEIPELALADDTHPEAPEHERADDVSPEIPELALADDMTMKVQDAPAKIVKAPDDTDELEDSREQEKTREQEETSAIPEGSVELAGLAGVINPQPQFSGHTETQDSQTQPENSLAASQHTRQRRVQPETQQVPHEYQETPESQEARADISVNHEGFSDREGFSEHDGNSDTEQHNQNPQNENHTTGQPQTQSRKTEARNLKTEAVTQKSDTETRRTESHSDFGTYFEGVLNSRRTTARVSAPMPLNLRTAENFTQASALRDGITNVVRFIRADGVQKARVVVDPPALGRVSVELTSGTSGVEASIKVASEQIRQLVQDQISQLRMNLSQQGVQVAEFTVDVQQDNSGNHGQQGQEQNAGRFGFVDDSDDDEAEDFRIDLDEGLLWWVA